MKKNYSRDKKNSSGGNGGRSGIQTIPRRTSAAQKNSSKEDECEGEKLDNEARVGHFNETV